MRSCSTAEAGLKGGRAVFFFQKKSSLIRKDYRLLWMALPFFLLVVMFSYVPLFGWIYGFFDYTPGVALEQSPFVGLKYFELLLADWPDVSRVLTNTLAMSFLSILCAPLPMAFAILLNEMPGRRCRKLVQTATTLPHFVSWIIVFSLSFAIFSYEGLINQILTSLGLAGTDVYSVLTDPNAVWMFQTALDIWKSLGWSAIIYLAAISSIDMELYDAAAIDGANRFKSILHVTVPGLLPTFIVLLLLKVSNIISLGLDQYFIFRNPLVADNIEVLDVYIYRLGIANNDFSYATAVGMLKSVVSITLLFSVNLFSKKIRGDSII